MEFGSLLFEPLEGEEDTRRAEERSSGAGAGVVAVRAGPGCAARAAAVAELLTAPACSVVSLSSSRADVSRQCTVSRQQTADISQQTAEVGLMTRVTRVPVFSLTIGSITLSSLRSEAGSRAASQHCEC